MYVIYPVKMHFGTKIALSIRKVQFSIGQLIIILAINAVLSKEATYTIPANKDVKFIHMAYSL